LSVRPHIALALLTAASWLPGGATALPKPPAADRHGDPLPPGAVARLGTARLRAVCESIHFSADGKTLIGVDGRLIRVWDASDGSLREVRRLPGTDSLITARSQNGSTLLLAGKSGTEVWDVPSANRLNLRAPQVDDRAVLAAVSNDRDSILLGEGVAKRRLPNGGVGAAETIYRIVLFDTARVVARVLSESEPGVIRLGLSPDCTRAVATGREGTRVWDTATGKRLWEVTDFNAEPVHFTADGKYLIAGPGGGQSQWHVWETDTGKPAKGLHLPTVGYAWTFAVSPDGNLLLIPTDTDYVQWDLRAGAIRHRWPGANQWGRGTFAPDGQSVVIYDTVLRRWDVTTGKNLYADVAPLGHTAAVRRIFFGPDGKRLISVADDRTARVWDVATSRPLQTVPLDPASLDAWALTPDGSTLVGVDQRLTVHRWPLDGRPKQTCELREAQRLGIGLTPRDVRVSPDGSTLILLGWPRSPEYRLYRYSFSFWDLATGRLLRWGGDPGRHYRGENARLSPGGRFAAIGHSLFDTRTGERRDLPAGPIGMAGAHVFSPDERLVAATISDGLRIWESATVRTLVDMRSEIWMGAAFSRDGRYFAYPDGARLVVWDLTRKDRLLDRAAQVWHDPGHNNWATGGIAFAPDGRTVATGNVDGTILLWSIPEPVRGEQWTDPDGANLWADLGDDDAATAYAAVWRLADHPADAVRLLRKQYPLAPALPAADWQALIAALDSPKFADREVASKKLAGQGRRAEAPLRRALPDASPEQRRRIDDLLAALKPPTGRPRGEDLRAVRAVAVVEACNTPEARPLLDEWAERGPIVRLADEAARAVERLKTRP
jgi:WD40 repeat protein